MNSKIDDAKVFKINTDISVSFFEVVADPSKINASVIAKVLKRDHDTEEVAEAKGSNLVLDSARTSIMNAIINHMTLVKIC
jgi:hypothetical protein